MKPMRWFDHLSINLFWLATNIRNNAVGALFLPYLVDQLAPAALKNSALGGLRWVGLVVAMLIQPAMGLLSDRSTSLLGRRRPFFIIGVALDLIFLLLLLQVSSFTALVAVLVLLQISANISHGPLQALIPDLVPESQRGVSSGVKAIFELLPLILVGFTIAALVSQGHFDWAIYATAASLVVILIPTLLLVRERPLREKPITPFGPPMLRVVGMLAGIVAGALAGLIAGALLGGVAGLIALPLGGANAGWIAALSLGGLVAMVIAVVVGVKIGIAATLGRAESSLLRPFPWWVINRLLFLAAVTSLQGFAPFFLMDAMSIDRDAATGLTGSLMTMVGIFTLLTAVPGGWIAGRVGMKRVIAISGLAAALGSFLLLGTVWIPNLALIYIAGSVLGLATGLFVTANWALGTDLVPAHEAGRYLGVSNLAGAGAGMIGSGIGGPIADALNAIRPGLGYFVLFASYGVLFLLSSYSVRYIRADSTSQPADAKPTPANSPRS